MAPRILKDILVDYANPMQGTDSAGDFSRGNTLPLVSMPFGMNHWSMSTGEGRWFFSPRAAKMCGFRCTHQPSPWMGDYCWFTVMPQVGNPMLRPHTRASIYRKDRTTIKPHYFSTYLGRYDTTLEFAPTERCGIFKVTFPESGSRRMIVENGDGPSSVRIDPGCRRIYGYTKSHTASFPEGYGMYFVVEFDTAFSAWGTFGGQSAQPGGIDLTSDGCGAYAEFDGSPERVLSARVATSFISEEQALANLLGEASGITLETAAKRAKDAWNGLLGRVAVEGATEDQLVTLYSCLYRAFLFPRTLHEYGPDGGMIHHNPYGGGIHPGPCYTDNGFWDTYRTVYSLFSLIIPEKLGEIMNGWLSAYRHGGWLPKWASPGYCDCMIGTHLDVIVPDLHLKGIKGFDPEEAYQAIRKDAASSSDSGAYGRTGLEDYESLGYCSSKVHHSVSRTLDFAYDDWGVAVMAKALGHAEDAERFASRSKFYKNVYDPAVGFMRARKPDGTWDEFSRYAWGGPYVEGSVWQCGWAVQHDLAGLIQLMGGRDAFCAKLDELLETPPFFDAAHYGVEIHEMTEMAAVDFGQYAHSNQPSHHLLYLYTAAGQPWKTQKHVRRVLNELYTPGYDGSGFAGDEDNGEMSAWYVLSSMGIFPLTVGYPGYALGSPLFERVTVHPDTGGSFTINAPGNGVGKDSPYVREVEVDGKPYTKVWVSHSDLVGKDDAQITFHMGNQPNLRELQGDELPYSLSTHGI